jgi:hypothetical protein
MTAPARTQHLCRCGCGRVPAPRRKYIADHYSGSNHPRWKGGVYTTKKGYRMLRPSQFAKPVFEHVVIAERALGRPLPAGAEVHHVNEDRADNSRGNLVLCQDHSYHMLIQGRTRAFLACGNANWLRCRYCKTYDDSQNLRVCREGPRRHVRAYHPTCLPQRSLRGQPV